MAAPIYAGVCILEFGTSSSGALATRFFAEQGATVIRIGAKPRRGHEESDPAFAAPREEPAPDADSAALAAGKHRIAIDLATDEGVALALRLVERADVVVDGLAPGALARFGLDPERLLLRKPDLVLVSVSLFGQTGPQRDARGDDAAAAAAIAGFSHLTGWADGPPVSMGDPLSPRYVALLVAAALLARRHSGRGQRIDVSQVEAGVYSLGERLVRWTAGHGSATRAGNRDDEAAPHGIYPCDRDDTWIAISVSDDEGWDALLAAMGDPGWATHPRFATRASRQHHADELDAGIAAWTRDFAPFELMAGLQAAGVAAGVVQHDAALRQDPQLAHRGHFIRLEHRIRGPVLVERAGFRIAEQAAAFGASSPSRVEDTDTVLRDRLGLEPQEVAALRARGAWP